MFDSLPVTLGDYRLESLVGEGHVAFVYRAVHGRTGQQVALKVLRPDSPVENARAYFQNEGVILAQLNHPNIPRLYEISEGETPFLAMQMIDGKDGEALLAALPEGEFLPIRNVIQWGIQIASALAYLHNHHPPIAFRDLKAAHIMVEGNQAWLVDFNLAKILPDSKFIARADEVGTEGFAAPEQYIGTVSPLADVYTLGATLHYLLTRIDPRRERAFSFAPPRSVNPLLSKSLSRVIMTALAYEPEDRFQSMETIQQELQNALEDNGSK